MVRTTQPLSPRAPILRPMTQPEPEQMSDALLSSVWMAVEASTRMPLERLGDRQPLPNELRFQVLVRDGFRCQWCSGSYNLQVDHVMPWSAGGSDEPTNLRLLCQRCNDSRSNFQTDVFSARPRPITQTCLFCEVAPEDAARIERAWCMWCFDLSPVANEQLAAMATYHWLDESWELWTARVRADRRPSNWPIWAGGEAAARLSDREHDDSALLGDY